MTQKVNSRERKFYKVLAIIIGVITAAILGEIILRLSDLRSHITDTVMMSQNPKLIYEHRPLKTFKNKYGIRIKYNNRPTIPGL